MKKCWDCITGKKIVLTPANAVSARVKRDLVKNGIECVGFFDNYKSGESIFNSATAIPPDHSVLITPTHYATELYEQLSESNKLREILFIDENLEVHQQTVEKESSFLTLALIRLLSKLRIQKNVVFLGVPFIDHNLYYAYREFAEQASHTTCFLIDQSELKAPSTLKKRCAAWINLVLCNVLILDHETTNEKILAIRANKKVVQLWHGIPFKRLSGNKGYLKRPDELFVSSSPTANQLYFAKQYWARCYSSAGYARNDNLYKNWLERSFDRSIEREQLERRCNSCSWLGVYMPTWRDSMEGKFFLDLLAMQRLLESKDGTLILKLHPLEVSELLAKIGLETQKIDGLDQIIKFPSIYIFPAQMDIYPLLPEANVLITDYSSVVFDVAPLKIPIVFFQPDFEAYEEFRGESYIPNEQFCIGPVATTSQDLIKILEESQYLKAKRFRIKRDKLVDSFKLQATASGHSIASLISSVHQK